jgi:hypothetical protein
VGRQLESLHEDERLRLGEAYLEQGLGEHASIAAFARLTLDLLALGAPPRLLDDTALALRDEIEHARLCFVLAKEIIGRPASPGPLDLSDEVSSRADPQAVLSAAVLEGCLMETISAGWADLAYRTTTDSHIRRSLSRIARDEARHADLSWEIVRWLVGAYPDSAAAAESAFQTGLSRVRNLQLDGMSLGDYGEDFGQPSETSRLESADATIRDVIVPRWQSLFN